MYVVERLYAGGPFEIVAEGGYVSPGFMDNHSDMIEQLSQPRPNTVIDFGIALREAEKQLINQGITTMYHAISLYTDNTFGKNAVRTLPNFKKLAVLIKNTNMEQHLINHRIHLRYEIENVSALPFILDLVKKRGIQSLSFTDHTPGQGQYKDLEQYHQQIMGYADGQMTEDEFQKLIAHHQTKQKVAFDDLCKLAKVAQENHIPVASHDDDTVEKLKTNQEFGINISEFPITLEVAQAAKARGMFTVAGAPNVLRGKSHTGNLSACEGVLANAVDILCSDYYPAAMLHAVFKLWQSEGLPLWKAMRLTTANPAAAMGIAAQVGTISPGKRADLLCIALIDHCPIIHNVLLHGQPVSMLCYAGAREGIN